jgi:hypothetical protein
MKLNKKYIKYLLVGSTIAIGGFFSIKIIKKIKRDRDSGKSTSTTMTTNKTTSSTNRTWAPGPEPVFSPAYKEEYTKAFDPLYYTTITKVKIMDYDIAADTAKKIEGSIHSWPFADDVDTIIEQIKRAGSKAALSKVSEVYADLFKKEMFEDLSNFLNKKEMACITDNIENLPDYLI